MKVIKKSLSSLECKLRYVHIHVYVVDSKKLAVTGMLSIPGGCAVLR